MDNVVLRILYYNVKYTYLGVDFTSNGAWDEHVKRVLQNGRKKISQVHSLLAIGILT